MFTLKKLLMTKILKKRKKNQPFDYEKAEAFALKTDGDGTFNNSYYFSAHSDKKKQSLYVRLGIRDNGNAEVWVYFCNDQKDYYHNRLLYTLETAPLKVTSDGGWKFSFCGKLTGSDGKDFDAKLDCTFIQKGDAVDFFYHMPAQRTATAMAQDKWTKEFFKGVQENNSVHYEQEGRLIGTLSIGEEQFSIDLPCLRDHSYGRRVWGYMNNHLWLAAVDEECMLNFSMVSYPSLSILEMGHLRERDNKVEFVTKASYDRNKIVKGEIPKEFSMVACIDKKRKISISAKLLKSIPYAFEDGAYTLIEGIADFVVDGIKCRGIFEIGFNKDKSRFMNGKKIEKIKE